MNPYSCTLYNCKSLNSLKKFLLIRKKRDFTQLKNNIENSPEKYYSQFTNTKGRDVCACSNIIKNYHTRLVKLFNIKQPIYLKSGIKNESNITNAKQHENSNFVLLLDIKSFFPSITKPKITNRLIMDYRLSKNVAIFISNLVTIGQTKAQNKRVLVTGSPISQHFAYICNKKMFDEIYTESQKHNITFSLFVDDLAFSSKKIIHFSFQKSIYNILQKYKYKVSNQKSYRGKIGNHANITGVKITKDGLRILEKHALKISNAKDPLELRGILSYSLRINKPFYKKLYAKKIKEMNLNY